jgi:hypothetical protein
MDPRKFNQAWEDFQPLHEQAKQYAPLTKEEEAEVRIIMAFVIYGTIAMALFFGGFFLYTKIF